jgi:hypothetical protein
MINGAERDGQTPVHSNYFVFFLRSFDGFGHHPDAPSGFSWIPIYRALFF